MVFKSHGSADAFAFERALNRAYDAARNQLLQRVRERIARAAPLLGNSTTISATGFVVGFEPLGVVQQPKALASSH